jgi:glycosyltransferase involved in cell wall biosynthesis
MKREPRVAFFTDSFLEVNGVANTSRHLVAFAGRRALPLLCVHAGPETGKIEDGSVARLSLKRAAISFKLDTDLRFDLMMWRHAKLAVETARQFKADLVHVTGPSDIGQLGAYVARKLRLPLTISWHTNVHEYAGTRLRKLLSFLPNRIGDAMARFAERQALRATLQFYKLGRLLLAPNEELGERLERECGKPVFMMRRGVDTAMFSPLKRERRDGAFIIGYVGRLTPEKNVRLLARLEKGLLEAGKSDFRFLIVGAGSEREWLEKNMRRAEFTGVLKGEPLARAYAALDAFVFPSHTDAFGNVALEAQASGAPTIVSAHGGPKFIVRDGVSGVVANDENRFLEAILELMSQPELSLRMREAARQNALSYSWDSVFEQVYQAYAACLQGVETKQQATALIRPSIAGANARE